MANAKGEIAPPLPLYKYKRMNENVLQNAPNVSMKYWERFVEKEIIVVVFVPNSTLMMKPLDVIIKLTI